MFINNFHYDPKESYQLVENGHLMTPLSNLTTHSHVYSSLISVNSHSDIQVNKLNIPFFSVQVLKCIYLIC